MVESFFGPATMRPRRHSFVVIWAVLVHAVSKAPAAQMQRGLQTGDRQKLAFTGCSTLPLRNSVLAHQCAFHRKWRTMLPYGSTPAYGSMRYGSTPAYGSMVRMQAESDGVRIDDFRQGSGAPVYRQGSAAASFGPPPVSKNLPSGSLREQREQLNNMELEREAWYEMMKRKVRASSYQNGMQDIRRLFSQFDVDKNGALDWTEYRTLLMRMGMRPFGVTDDDLRILFKEMGASGRGMEVKAREFFSWFSPSPQTDGAERAPQLDEARQKAAEAPQAARIAAQPALAGETGGWTYGESLWWDEGPETRVLHALEQRGTVAGKKPGVEPLSEMTAVPAESGGKTAKTVPVEATAPSASDFQRDDTLEALVAGVEPWTVTSRGQLYMSVYYLANEIGLEHSTVQSLALQTPSVFALDVDSQLRPRVDELREIGVPVGKLSKLLSVMPDILEGEGWEKRQGALSFLRTLGVRQDKLGACIVRYPRVLDLSVATMASVVEFLIGAGRIPRSKVCKMVEVMPSLLSHSVEYNLRPKLVFLVQDVGIAPEKVAGLLLKFPQVLGLSVEGNLRPTLRYLTDEVNIPAADVSRIVSSVPQLLGLSVETNLRAKVRYLEHELRVPEVRLAEVIAKCPALLSLSVEKNLQPKVHFLTEEAGFSLDEITKAPNVLTYSIVRMRSRHEFLKGKGLRIGLASMVSYSEAQFQKRFDHNGELV